MRNSDRPGVKELLGRRPRLGPYESRNPLVFSLLYCFEVAQAPQQADTAMAIIVQVLVDVSEVELFWCTSTKDTISGHNPRQKRSTVNLTIQLRLFALSDRIYTKYRESEIRFEPRRGDGGHGLTQISLESSLAR